MTTFHLTVVTPDGCAFEGQAERIVCRAIDGDLAILAKHGDYCTALGMGEAHIVDADGQRRRAACMGGLLSVLDGDVRLVATTWEWAEDIDQARAEASKKRAEEILARKNLNDREYELAQARLKRALGAPLSVKPVCKKAPAAGWLWVPFVLSGKKYPFRLAQGDGNPLSHRYAMPAPPRGNLARERLRGFLTPGSLSRSGCGCGAQASPQRCCSHRRWAQ